MKITLEIVNAAAIWGERRIEELNEKNIVPNPIARRRLTRNAKILLYLADKISFKSGNIIFGTEFGECGATSEIINAILKKEAISPTAFQNSVHNTAASYLSIHTDNKDEIITVSDFGKSSLSALKAAAISSFECDEALIACVDSLDFAEIEEMNSCSLRFLECGVAFAVRTSQKTADITLGCKKFDGFLEGHHAMLELYEHFEAGGRVFEVSL